MDRIPPTSDLAFKKVFTSEESKDILAGLIEDFFEVEALELAIEKPYSIAICKEFVENQEVSRLRETLKDVAATFKIADFVSEMQVHKALFFDERSIYYPLERFCKNYARAGHMTLNADGKPYLYSSLRPEYALNILGYNHYRDDAEALRIFELYDPKRSKSFGKKLLRFGYFELSKPEVETANQKHWQDYFNTGVANPDAPDYIKKASSIIDWLNLTEEERTVFSTLERLEANDLAERGYVYEEGKAEGIALGKTEGIALGKDNKAVEVAKSMLEADEPLEKIAKYTGLSYKAIKTL